MIIEKKVKTWKEFKVVIKKITRRRRRQLKRYKTVSDLIFRGQENPTWILETTYERHIKKCRFPVKSFNQFLKEKIQDKLPEQDLEFLSQEIDLNWWDFPSNIEEVKRIASEQHYEGFTPYLDWTKSLYIAAHFAFNGNEKHQFVALYTYIHHAGKNADGGWGDPRTNHLTYRPHNARQKAQKGEFTICRSKTHNEIYYESHQQALMKKESQRNVLYKFLIPYSEREKVLFDLERKGINKQSLLL